LSLVIKVTPPPIDWAHTDCVKNTHTNVIKKTVALNKQTFFGG
jgi:hypothetical protein